MILTSYKMPRTDRVNLMHELDHITRFSIFPKSISPRRVIAQYVATIDELITQSTSSLIALLHNVTLRPIASLHKCSFFFMQASGASTRALTRDELPAEFFFVSRDDLRTMIEEQQKAIEEGGMLLTKAMRERLRVRERRVYRYVLIRVRMPGELVLQVSPRVQIPCLCMLLRSNIVYLSPPF